MTTKFEQCKQHDQCRHVAASGDIFELINCPWCDYSVSESNIGKWCAKCYTLFRTQNGRVHFCKTFPKSVAIALAIAMQKTGGATIGSE